LKSTIESLAHPFYVIDADDYTVKMANSATQLAAVDGKSPCYALTHNKDRPCGTAEHPCPLETIKETKQPVTTEHIHYGKDGDVRNVEVHASPIFDMEGNVIQMIEYCLDITERKQAEEALQKHREELRIIFDSVPSGIWYKDKENRLIRVNRAAAESISMKPEDIEGRPVCEIFPEEAEHYYKDDLEVIKSGKPKWGIIEQMQVPGGENKWVRTDKVPYRDEQGNVAGVVFPNPAQPFWDLNNTTRKKVAAKFTLASETTLQGLMISFMWYQLATKTGEIRAAVYSDLAGVPDQPFDDHSISAWIPLTAYTVAVYHSEVMRFSEEVTFPADDYWIVVEASSDYYSNFYGGLPPESQFWVALAYSTPAPAGQAKRMSGAAWVDSTNLLGYGLGGMDPDVYYDYKLTYRNSTYRSESRPSTPSERINANVALIRSLGVLGRDSLR